MAAFFRKKSEKREKTGAEAFAEEALEHMDALYRLAFRLTRHAEDAEDLVQDCFVRAVAKYEQFREGTNLRAWLMRMMTNQFINQYRRGTRKRQIFEGVDGRRVGHGVMSSATVSALTRPIGLAERQSLVAEIDRALSELPEEQRTIVLLTDIEGFSYREVAETLECPMGTVMSRLHRARATLRESLRAQAEAIGLIEEEQSSGMMNDEVVS